MIKKGIYLFVDFSIVHHRAKYLKSMAKIIPNSLETTCHFLGAISSLPTNQSTLHLVNRGGEEFCLKL